MKHQYQIEASYKGRISGRQFIEKRARTKKHGTYPDKSTSSEQNLSFCALHSNLSGTCNRDQTNLTRTTTSLHLYFNCMALKIGKL